MKTIGKKKKEWVGYVGEKQPISKIITKHGIFRFNKNVYDRKHIMRPDRVYWKIPQTKKIRFTVEEL